MTGIISIEEARTAISKEREEKKIRYAVQKQEWLRGVERDVETIIQIFNAGIVKPENDHDQYIVISFDKGDISDEAVNLFLKRIREKEEWNIKTSYRGGYIVFNVLNFSNTQASSRF